MGSPLAVLASIDADAAWRIQTDAALTADEKHDAASSQLLDHDPDEVAAAACRSGELDCDAAVEHENRIAHDRHAGLTPRAWHRLGQLRQRDDRAAQRLARSSVARTRTRVRAPRRSAGRARRPACRRTATRSSTRSGDGPGSEPPGEDDLAGDPPAAVAASDRRSA